MKTKDTTIKFTSKSGKEVIVTVHRKYGAYIEHHHDSEDGIDYDTNEFANDSYISVDVPSVCKFCTKYLPDMKHPKINMYYLSDGRYCVGVPDEIAEQIRKAEEEHLTEDIPASDAAEIQMAKAAIKNNRIMPAAQLRAEWKKYNDLYNEGAEGYNPFSDYISEERLAAIKAKYPEKF